MSRAPSVRRTVNLMTRVRKTDPDLYRVLMLFIDVVGSMPSKAPGDWYSALLSELAVRMPWMLEVVAERLFRA